MEKRSKRWTKEETTALLHFYAARKDEFQQQRKKKNAFANVVEDMISAGFDSNISAHLCEVKMQTLLRAYKSAKDNAKATGASPCTPPFFPEMDEIFGSSPIYSKSESMNVGMQFLSNESTSSPTLTPPDDMVPTAPELNFAQEDIIEEESAVEFSAASVFETPTPANKKQKLSKCEYLKLRINQKDKELKLRQERLELAKEKESNKMERFKERTKLMKELLKQ